MSAISLSILIPSVTERLQQLTTIYSELARQALNLPVEILALVDNKRRTTGAKRNQLLTAARGRYVSFVDDDDKVAPDYVQALLHASASDPDCIVFEVMVYMNGAPDRVTRFHPSYEHANLPSEYRRKPNHVMCYRREIAIRHAYQDTSFGEDTDWAARASRDALRVHQISKVLYHYDVVPKDTNWYFKG